MTQFNMSLRLILFGVATALVAGCDFGSKAEDTAPTDSDADTDADSDADSDADPETGKAALAFVGDFTVTDGAFTSAHMGYGYYGLEAEDYVCTAIGSLPAGAGEAAAGCPDCEWAFALGGIENTVATGDYCGDFAAGVDGSLDTYFEYSWGFTYEYTYVADDGTEYLLADSLMLYTDKWFAFAFNYGGRYSVGGDASYLTFGRNAYDQNGEVVYYYYYP